MSVHKKLFKAKQEIGKLTKDSKNPFFKSNYLSLNGLIEAVEIKGHPWFLGVQFHPEFTSRLQTPNPTILAFVKNSKEHS